MGIALNQVSAETAQHGFVARCSTISKAVFVESANFLSYVKISVFETDALEIGPALRQ